jgi:hypothetical protein
VLAVRDTSAWARAEARQHPRPAGLHPSVREIAALVSWNDRTLAAVSQAGLVSNLNDGLVWVILPVLLVEHASGPLRQDCAWPAPGGAAKHTARSPASPAAMPSVAAGTAGACRGQQQSSPCQDRMPSRTATAAMPRPMRGSIHQPPGQAAVMASTASTAAACAAHR